MALCAGPLLRCEYLCPDSHVYRTMTPYPAEQFSHVTLNPLRTHESGKNHEMLGVIQFPVE